MEAVYIIWMHFLADFLAQGPNMIEKKTNNIYWMVGHCFVYSLFFIYFGGIYVAMIIGITHFLVDYFAAKLTQFCWDNGHRHGLHVALGADQALHLTILAILFF